MPINLIGLFIFGIGVLFLSLATADAVRIIASRDARTQGYLVTFFFLGFGLSGIGLVMIAIDLYLARIS